ncbi:MULTISPECIES: YbjN domain-containing protein [Euryhalocaulis]|uniref:YbjN domain-containing protein n=1 Tax=Euryhalocaulis TaxID=1712422 RepID=UPI0003A0005A|nr:MULTISPECIES: YbjN domain-containing protein [Euryhalocaulis]MBA4801570.1 YbjN domain-containing protein [Euryhalocaulis sp.]
MKPCRLPVLGLIAALLLAALGQASPARAAEEVVYQALSPKDVMEILLLNALPAELDSIPGGGVVADQRVVVSDRIAWFVYLYNCNDQGRCSDIQLRTAFSGAAPSLDAINDWNRTHRFTRAYRAEDGSAVLEMDINAEGGVTVGHVSSLIPLWREAMTRYYFDLEDRSASASASGSSVQ